jgi:hypothetical protein
MKAILTRYHGPSNVKGARISASDSDKNRVVLSWDHALDSAENHARAAKTLCEKMNWRGEMIGGGLHNGDMAWTFANSDDRFTVGPSRAPAYTLEAGRSILKDGLPFVHLDRSMKDDKSQGYHFDACDADDFARAIVEKFAK